MHTKQTANRRQYLQGEKIDVAVFIEVALVVVVREIIMLPVEAESLDWANIGIWTGAATLLGLTYLFCPYRSALVTQRRGSGRDHPAAEWNHATGEQGMKPESPFFKESIQCLIQSSLFSGLARGVVEEMVNRCRRETWKRRRQLPMEETWQRFHILLSGRVRLSRSNPETGRMITLFLLGPRT